MREGEFERAHTDFFEAFKNYDESGSPRRTTCLKYLVLANMLMKSGINPFDSQEAKPYKNDPEILAMTNLVVSYQNNDINEFESILRNNRNNIMADPFIREHIEGEYLLVLSLPEFIFNSPFNPSDLLRNIRTQVLVKLIRPYTRIAITFISNELNIEPAEVESLLVSCILDKCVGKDNFSGLDIKIGFFSLFQHDPGPDRSGESSAGAGQGVALCSEVSSAGQVVESDSIAGRCGGQQNGLRSREELMVC